LITFAHPKENVASITTGDNLMENKKNIFFEKSLLIQNISLPLQSQIFMGIEEN